MLSESSSHRQQRLEREPERLAVKGLHRFDVVGEDSDVYLWPRKIHVNLPPGGDARAYRASRRKSNPALIPAVLAGTQDQALPLIFDAG
jgi:hypothetical protein